MNDQWNIFKFNGVDCNYNVVSTYYNIQRIGKIMLDLVFLDYCYYINRFN